VRCPLEARRASTHCLADFRSLSRTCGETDRARSFGGLADCRRCIGEVRTPPLFGGRSGCLDRNGLCGHHGSRHVVCHQCHHRRGIVRIEKDSLHALLPHRVSAFVKAGEVKPQEARHTIWCVPVLVVAEVSSSWVMVGVVFLAI
jgi:hypothetical protein